MSYYVELTDVTGKTWRSDTADEDTPANLSEAIESTLEDGWFGRINAVIRGSNHHFNPTHIVSFAVVEQSR